MSRALESSELEMRPIISGKHDDTTISRKAVRPPMVLHVRVVTGNGGGPEKTILNSPRFLSKLGYQSRLAYLHPPGDPGILRLQERGQALNAEVISIPDKGALDLSVITKSIRLCRELQVDIWHGHDYKSNLLGLLVRAFHRMQLVTTLHGWGVTSGRMPLYIALDKMCLKYYRALICVSEDLLQSCLAARAPTRHCHLVHNAIDIEEYQRQIDVISAKRQLGVQLDGSLVGAVGRLSAEKGYDLLIRAVHSLRQQGKSVYLWIAGEGDERAELERLVNQLGCGNYVRLLGHVSDPKLFYQAMDVYALSSLREGLPNVVLEAMAFEIPVVATRVGGVAMLVEHEVSGLVVEPNNAQALAKALDRIVSDRSLSKRFGRLSRQRVEDNFCFSRRMEKVVEIYNEVLKCGICK